MCLFVSSKFDFPLASLLQWRRKILKIQFGVRSRATQKCFLPSPRHQPPPKWFIVGRQSTKLLRVQPAPFTSLDPETGFCFVGSTQREFNLLHFACGFRCFHLLMGLLSRLATLFIKDNFSSQFSFYKNHFENSWARGREPPPSTHAINYDCRNAFWSKKKVKISSHISAAHKIFNI